MKILTKWLKLTKLLLTTAGKLNSRFVNTGKVFSITMNLPKRKSVFVAPSIKLQNNIVDVDFSYTLEKRGVVSNRLGCVKVKLNFWSIMTSF